MAMVTRLMTPMATPTRFTPAAKVGVEPLPFAPRGLADRSAALVELRRDAVEAGDRAFNLVGDFGHLLSIGVNGEGAPSSLAWFTPSARAI